MAGQDALPTIFVTPDNGPIRTIITGRRHIPTGRYASVKSRRAQPWESREVELPSLMEAEVRSSVVWYCAQPLRLDIGEGRDRQSYIPDLGIRELSADGTRWRTRIIECKRTMEEITQDLHYAAKLELAKAAFRRMGWEFEIRTIRDLGPPAVRQAIHLIQLERCTRIDARDIGTIREVITRSCGAAPYSVVCEALGGPILGRKRLHALIVHRIAAISLSRPPTHSSPVTLVDRSREPPAPRSLFE